MQSSLGRRPSPALIVAVLALVAAVAGTAVAGPDATTSAINTKKVKKLAKKQAKKQINKLAPGLSVANAATADNAANADTLGGRPASAFLSTNTPGVPIAGARIAADGSVSQSFNRVGGAPTVVHTPASGFYILSFPGLAGQVCDTNSVALVSLGGGSDGLINRGCSPGPPNGDLSVRTRTPANVASDEPFDIVIFAAGG